MVWFVSAESDDSTHNKNTISANTVVESQKDTDKDGIADWEEVLQGTNPLKADSNDDGLPDVKTMTSAHPSMTETIDSSPTKTLLESLSLYFAEKVSGKDGEEVTVDFDDKSRELLVQTSITEAKKLASKRDPYKESDLNIDPNETLYNYFNNVALVTQKHFPESSTETAKENEMTILYSIAEELSKDSTSDIDVTDFKLSLLRIEPYQARYASATKDLLSIKTPTQAVNIQLGFLNSFANTSLALTEIMAYHNDAIVGMIGMQSYIQQLDENKKLFSNVKKIIAENNVIFEDEDPAYEFRAVYVSKK